MTASFDSKAAQDRLKRWHSVAAFGVALDAIDEAVGDAAIEATGFGCFRDAWTGLHCAKATGAAEIRLGADPPDVELAYADGSAIRLEVVEALRSGRRRGDEIREDRAKTAGGLSVVRDDPAEVWPTARDVLEALTGRAVAKAQKGYSSGTVLAIYLNVGDWDNERRSIEAGMADALGAALEAFVAVWVLWHGRLYLADSAGGVRFAAHEAGQASYSQA
jgi:hypothetical protein